MNKVFAAFWYSGILPLLFCTTTIPTTTTFKNHESLSRPEPAKKEGTKAKQNRKQNREKGFLWLKDKWRSVADKSSACYKNGGMRQSSSFSDVQSQGVGSSIGPIYSYSSVHGGVEGESAQRCKPRLERHRRTAERAAKALAEKNRLLEEEQHLQAAVERATAEARQRAFQKLIAEEAAFEAELSRLTKVVQESKTEFSRRKSSRNLQVSSSKTEISTSPYKTRGKHTEPIPQSSTENRDNIQDSGVFVTEEGECASSVLTEEPQPEVLEMDRLEAELESELQKLPWCSTEASGFEGKISDICEFNTDIHVQDSGVFVTGEGECASSVLTEEPQPEVLEMDRLEAELESELQKLPWCSTEASGFEGKISDICEFNTDIHVQDSGVFVTEEGECASSVLTEEPQPEVLEMDRLEAELESELQKLPWCSTEASGFEGKISDICEFNTDIHVQDSGVFVTGEGECASSVLTEEPQPEVLEMDRLEAELESELQKLPWCSTEASGFEGKISDICEFNTDIHVQDSGVFVTEEGECASSVLTEEPQPEVLEMDRLEAELESELQKLLWCSTEASGFEGKISDICEFNTDIHVQDSGVFVIGEGECASSVLTEEPQPEVLEMDRLEAELESELQKLPWCSTEASGFEGKISDICEFNTDDASFEGFYKPDGQTSDSCQLSGVLPSELDQKLCHLLIKQQESQIVGLESELHWAQSKLHEKEAELQALKDCVKRVTEFSLATASEARQCAAVERATAEARQRAFQKVIAEEAAFEARKRVERSVADKSSACYKNGGMRQSSSFSDVQSQGVGSSISPIYSYSSVHGGVEGESAQRCKPRLERHRRTAERAAKALAEKNVRDLLAEREQAERNRLAEALDAEVKRWSSGKEANLRALLSTLQYILGPDSGWQPNPLTEVITSAAVKKAYRKATLCVHPDKLQQRGASVRQKYICEKVFDLLKEAWNGFNSEEQ